MFGDVPVMVTFFISSSVCRHCKTTYDVFGVLLLNFKYANMVIKQDFYFINREVYRLLPRVSTLLLDLAFSHAWKIMFDPSFLMCNVYFNMCMHNLYHSLYHYATSFFSELTLSGLIMGSRVDTAGDNQNPHVIISNSH